MRDDADGPAPGPNTLILQAVFVPDGESPPPEFSNAMDPLRFAVTLDPETGSLTSDEFGSDVPILAQFIPDEGGETGTP